MNCRTMTKTEALVLLYLEKTDGRATTGDIVDDLPINKAHTTSILLHMKTDGKVERQGRLRAPAVRRVTRNMTAVRIRVTLSGFRTPPP